MTSNNNAYDDTQCPRNDPQGPLHLAENRGNKGLSGAGTEAHQANVMSVTSDMPLVTMIQNASDESLSELRTLLGVEEHRSLNGIPAYSGTPGEIIEDFFDNYELATEAKGWNDEKRKKILPLFLLTK